MAVLLCELCGGALMPLADGSYKCGYCEAVQIPDYLLENHSTSDNSGSLYGVLTAINKRDYKKAFLIFKENAENPNSPKIQDDFLNLLINTLTDEVSIYEETELSKYGVMKLLSMVLLINIIAEYCISADNDDIQTDKLADVIEQTFQLLVKNNKETLIGDKWGAYIYKPIIEYSEISVLDNKTKQYIEKLRRN